MNPHTTSEALHSTIVATAYPVAGKEQEWEHAIGNLIRTAMTFRGYRGSMFLKPESSDSSHYRVITNFDNDENMKRWYNSPERLEKVAGLNPFQERPTHIEHVSEYEFWLTPPDVDAVRPKAPPKYKTFMIVWFALYVTIMPLNEVLKPLLIEHFSLLLTNAILAAIGVALLTWGVLPVLNRLLNRWLYPSQQ